MSEDTSWDVNKYKYHHELEHHWELKKAFILAHKDKYPEKRLICLAQTFYNIEVLGCRYDAPVMMKVRSLAEVVAPVTSKLTKEKEKYSKGFVAASNAVVDRVKARLGTKEPAVVPENSGREDALKPVDWKTAAAARKRQWNSRELATTVEKHPRVEAPEPTSEESKRGRAPWLSKIDIGTVVRSGPFGRVVVFEGGQDNPATIIERTAAASQMTTSFNFVQTKQEVCCQFSLNGLFLASGNGGTQKLAKEAACTQAVDRLKQTCFTVQDLKDNPETHEQRELQGNQPQGAQTKDIQICQNDQDNPGVTVKLFEIAVLTEGATFIDENTPIVVLEEFFKDHQDNPDLSQDNHNTHDKNLSQDIFSQDNGVQEIDTCLVSHSTHLSQDNKILHDSSNICHDEEHFISPETQENMEATKRKRKYFTPSLAERNAIKKLKPKNEHEIKETCSHEKCHNQITSKRRREINEEYWSYTSHEQQLFVCGLLYVANSKRTLVGPSSRRKQSVKFYFKNDVGENKEVCKVFFLTTLGFNKKNDNIISKCISSVVKNKRCSSNDGRSKPASFEPHNKINKEPIVEHIQSFNPNISHYRREHAPKRLYLPSDLSIEKMYRAYIADKNQGDKNYCSYEVYRVQVKALNISFVKLGHEQCEYCEHYDLHGHDKENMQIDCEECRKWKKHLDNAKNARKEYENDAALTTNEDILIYSMDLQKVIMLPRCDMFKNVIFAQRLVVFNETFAPVGKKKDLPVVPVLWHEGIRGRNQEDIISTVEKFLSSTPVRDSKNIILWMDNCRAQNKIGHS